MLGVPGRCSGLGCPRTGVDFEGYGQVVGTFQEIILVLRVLETAETRTVSSLLAGRVRGGRPGDILVSVDLAILVSCDVTVGLWD